ncbi:MAG: DAK2 domain-containing protein, partial [Christensenellales bacterium]
MSLNILKAQNFEQMALYGAINLKAYSQVVNDLNVYPIADGDTGDNMYMTISSGVNAIKGKGFTTIGDVADNLSRGMLMGARGNSGVILSQIFYGIAEGFRGLESANVEQVGNAFRLGVKRAYEAVVVPTEGTILTVIREATEFACLNINEKSTIESFMRDLAVEMDNSLERTPELLYVLKEAGVVDSGGKGLLYIVQGMCKALNGESLHSESVVDNSANESKTVDLDKF